MVTKKTWFSQQEGAEFLGWQPATLCKARRRSFLYRPAQEGLPWDGERRSRGRRHVRYHRRQLEEILAVATGQKELSAAEAAWFDVFRSFGATPVTSK